MYHSKAVQLTKFAPFLRQSIAVRMQSSTGAAGSIGKNLQKVPPTGDIKDPKLPENAPQKDPPVPPRKFEGDAAKNSSEKCYTKNFSGAEPAEVDGPHLKFDFEPMGEDIAIVLKPPEELKETSVDMHQERSSTFDKASYMEKGADYSQEKLQGGFEEDAVKK